MTKTLALELAQQGITAMRSPQVLSRPPLTRWLGMTQYAVPTANAWPSGG